MGCSESKVDDSPLVVRCRERRECIRAAANHRYALAAAHVAYLTSLKNVGDALRRFVDEELATSSNSSSSSPSPSLPPPSKVKPQNGDGSLHHLHEGNNSHLNIHDSSSSSDDDLEDDCNHKHYEHCDSDNGRQGFDFGAKSSHNGDRSSSHYPGNLYGYTNGSMNNQFYSLPNHSQYYMKKSAPEMKTVFQDPQSRSVYGYLGSYWASPASCGDDYGYFGMGNAPVKESSRKESLPPPSPPVVPAWDYFNPFDVFDGGYEGYGYGYGYMSGPNSPYSSDVREREGIPDLEEETDNEVCRSIDSSLRKSVHSRISDESMEHPSRAPPQVDQTVEEDVEGSISLETLVSNNVDDQNSVKKKEEVGSRGNRDLREVVAEIQDDFEDASSYGKEVAMMLEVGKLPYQPGFLKEVLSRILYIIAPLPCLRDLSSVKLASRSMKLAESYFEDVGKDVNAKVCNLSSTLDKLYAWEKKLCKEVKDEERLRVLYEKQCRRLKMLNDKGADSDKISATQASIRKLLTKLDVSIKAIDVVSNRINKLRDDELQPNLDALIHGLIRMWKAMLKCHQKQFQAIMESKMQKLKCKTSLQTEPTSRATTELEKELRLWCQHFSNWITFQKSYIESLNSWLLQSLQYDQEDGKPVPYSPTKIGAPPVFVICNDWLRAMEGVSGGKVLSSMNALVKSLQQLWENRDEEGRQRVKAEYILKDYEKMDRKSLSVITSDDDMSLNSKSDRERIKHQDAMKLLCHLAASRNLKGGLVPIFKALENFSCEAVKAHEHIRLVKHNHESS